MRSILQYAIMLWERFFFNRKPSFTRGECQYLQQKLAPHQSVLQDLLDILVEKRVSLDMRDSFIDQWISIYKGLSKDYIADTEEDALISQAKETFLAGEFLVTEHLILRSLEYTSKEKKEKVLRIASKTFILGCLKELQGDHDAAQSYYEQVIRVVPHHTNALRNLGRIFLGRGTYQKAVTYYELVTNNDYQDTADLESYLGSTWHQLGSVWAALREHQKAIVCYDHALLLYQQKGGGQHPEMGNVLLDMGKILPWVNEFERAFTSLEQSTKIYRKVYGTWHPKVAMSLEYQGDIWKSLQKYQKAIPFYKKAIKTYRHVYGTEHLDVARNVNNMGLTCESLGKYQKAITYFSQALMIYRDIHGDQHWHVAILQQNIARAWEALGNYQAAFTVLQEAQKSLESSSESDPQTKHAQKLIRTRIEHLQESRQRR